MAQFVSGDVVVLPFPFTDLQSSKVRPALVLAVLSRGDVVLCQITSQAAGHPKAIALVTSDFEFGQLPLASFALPHRLVTAHNSCISRKAGRLLPTKLDAVRKAVCSTIYER